jgi:hypothetical protein
MDGHNERTGRYSDQDPVLGEAVKRQLALIEEAIDLDARGKKASAKTKFCLEAFINARTNEEIKKTGDEVRQAVYELTEVRILRNLNTEKIKSEMLKF